MVKTNLLRLGLCLWLIVMIEGLDIQAIIKNELEYAEKRERLLIQDRTWKSLEGTAEELVQLVASRDYASISKIYEKLGDVLDAINVLRDPLFTRDRIFGEDQGDLDRTDQIPLGEIYQTQEDGPRESLTEDNQGDLIDAVESLPSESGEAHRGEPWNAGGLVLVKTLYAKFLDSRFMEDGHELVKRWKENFNARLRDLQNLLKEIEKWMKFVAIVVGIEVSKILRTKPRFGETVSTIVLLLGLGLTSTIFPRVVIGFLILTSVWSMAVIGVCALPGFSTKSERRFKGVVIKIWHEKVLLRSVLGLGLAVGFYLAVPPLEGMFGAVVFFLEGLICSTLIKPSWLQ